MRKLVLILALLLVAAPHALRAPWWLVLLGANANNLLLIPLAYGVLHLAMGEARSRRMSLGVELGLLLTLWAIVNFTAVNLYLTWTG